MNKIVNVLKKYMYVVAIFLTMSIILSVSFSNFIVTSNNHKAAEMYVGELKYSMEIDNENTNTLTVPTGETIIDVKVNNLNPVDTYYKLLYLNNSNLKVEYFESAKELDDSNNITKTYDKPNSSITSENTNSIKLKVTNNSTSSQSFSLSVKGGYINNTLNDIKVPSGYSAITTIETPSSNTYFCKTSDTLTQGLEYVNGGYTYGYKKRYIMTRLQGLHYYWDNVSTDGWGVMFTNKSDTSAVTSKLCTYINNKPIQYMSFMFANVTSPSLDLSSFNTKML